MRKGTRTLTHADNLSGQILSGYWDAAAIVTSGFVVATAADWADGNRCISDEAKENGWSVEGHMLGVPCPFISGPDKDLFFVWTTRGLFTVIGRVEKVELHDTPNGTQAVYIV